MTQNLSDAIADVHADIDDLVESKKAAFKIRYIELLNKPQYRNVKMWEQGGVDMRLIGITPANIETVSKGQHDDLWLFAMGGIRAACRRQAIVETMGIDLMSVCSKGRKLIKTAASRIDPKALRDHAKKGTPRSAFSAAKERRKNAKASQ